MKAFLDEVPTPAGPISIATDEAGTLLGLRFREGRAPKSPEMALKREGFEISHNGPENVTEARKQIVEYFAGEREGFDVAVSLRGSDFERAVWNELSRIPFGETRTYGRIAESVGGPASAVDVGKACAANPVLLVVPCHRVISADGSLKGYSAGLPIKARLLDLEEAHQRLFP